MATEKQIEANRRNARRSTGPRTKTGKKRAGNNALSHGLTSIKLRALDAERVEQLAREIAGDFKDRIILELARSAAAAEIELARVREVKAEWAARAFTFGTLKPPAFFSSEFKQVEYVVKLILWMEGKRRIKPAEPVFVDPSISMPAEEKARIAEAVRRILPQLLSIQRYERLL